MGIENKNYRDNFSRNSNDSSFILDDFDEDIELHVNPFTRIQVMQTTVEIHSPNNPLDDNFSL